MIKRVALIALLVTSALICSLPATLSETDEAARDAALRWLQLVDASRYEEAASQASGEVRPFEHWMNRFKTQRAAIGRANHRHFAEMKHTSMVTEIPGVRRYQIIRFKTSFERNAAAVEEVTIAKVGCCWEIFGYEINDR